jgi:hypothetical protein
MRFHVRSRLSSHTPNPLQPYASSKDRATSDSRTVSSATALKEKKPHSADSEQFAGWRNIVDQLYYLSYICNDRSEVLAWNRAANRTTADFPALPAQERVMTRFVFVDPEYRRRMMNFSTTKNEGNRKDPADLMIRSGIVKKLKGTRFAVQLQPRPECPCLPLPAL